MCIRGEQTVCGLAVSIWGSDGLCEDDGYDESVNTQDTRHDNGDDVLDDSGGVVNTHFADSASSLPGSPCRTEVGKDHA